MTTLAPLPVQSFKDSNGNPLAGGLLYTYAAGTSTAQSTYLDSTGVSANTNPIVLNSRGEAAIWLTGGLAYKFILQDASANLIWSVDQITSPVTGGNPVALASAATTDIGGQGSSAVEISGTTTITSLGSNYSGPRFVRFAGALTLTYALPAINLPAAANITTAVGDVAIFYPNLALNGWNLMAYTKAAGLAASSGANGDITSLAGLTTALTVAQGGTGATTASAARTALGVATVGVNSLQLGSSTTDSQNFLLKTNLDGSGKLSRGAAGGLGDVFTWNSTGIITGIASASITPAMLTIAATPLAVSQTWQSVVGSRVIGTTYYNTGIRPIAVQAAISSTTTGTQTLVISGVSLYGTTAAAGGYSYSFGIVPASGSYTLTRDGGGTQTLYVWAELL